MRKTKDYRNKKKLTALCTRYSVREIGALYGVSGNAIWKWQKFFGIEATVEDRRVLEMILDLKRKTGLSFNNIAELANISSSQAYRIKDGKNKNPRSQTFRKLEKLHRRICKELKEE